MLIKILNIIFINITLMLVLFSCAGSPRFTTQGDTVSNKSDTSSSQTEISEIKTTKYNDVAILESVTGIASYYADAFNGKITYNGEVYDMYGISAAHQTYPMGTVIRVTNLKNGKSVKLKINDRMPYNHDRIIDLSLGTAQKLEMVDDGLTEVRIDVLKFGKGR